ncbi:MAG: hypothetical protein QM733_07030 [Ilumatobacteraceae bacterium]
MASRFVWLGVSPQRDHDADAWTEWDASNDAELRATTIGDGLADAPWRESPDGGRG